jgi:hypothetical protein
MANLDVTLIKVDGWSHKKLLLQNKKKCKKYSVADPDPESGAFLTPGSGIRDG